MIRLLSLEVRAWRGLTYRLGDLAPDLNLVVGPNESGKSRLFEALRFGLFERHKGGGKSKERLRAWGSGEVPEVSVSLEIDGVPYEVHKRFLKDPHALLTGRGESLRDDDAEARLAELLGYRRPKRGVTATEDRGIWPLLWVEQGGSGTPAHEPLNDDARGRLRDVLAREVGDIATGPFGEQILERARAERRRYYTDRAGSESGELAAARKTLHDAIARRDKARARVDRAHSVADELANAREERATLGPRIEARQAALSEMEERAQRVQQLATNIETLKERREARAGQVKEAEREAAHWRKLRAELTEKRKEHARLADALEEGTARAHAAQSEAEEARRQAEIAKAEIERAQKAERRARLAVQRHEALARLDRARKAHERATELTRKADTLDAEIRRLRVDAETLESIRAAARAADRAEAELSAVAARLTVRARRELTIDGEALSAGEARELRVDSPRSLEIDDVAEVHVAPGGPDLDSARDRMESARRQRDELLDQAAVSSLLEAEAQAKERAEKDSRLRTLREQLKEVAPGGIDALAEAVRAAEAELDLLPRLEETREEGGDDVATAAPQKGAGGGERAESARFAGDASESSEPAAGASLSDETDPSSLSRILRAAERRRESAAAAYELARENREAAAKRESEAQRDVQEHRRRVADAEETQTRLEAELAEAPAENTLAERVATAQNALQAEDETLEELHASLENAGGANAEADLEREQKALSDLENRGRELDQKMQTLEGELRAYGGEALHEDLEEAEAEVARGEDALAHVERRALAARRLYDALREARRRAEERLLAPVIQRATPYLKDLFPGSALALDEDWYVRGIHTRGLDEPLDELSAGAREQVGVVVRIALAELLAGGKALPVVLDDPLVSTDSARRAAMLRILYRAARSGLQILVFSCHEVAFDGLGATRRYALPAGRAPSSRDAREGALQPG